MAEKVGKWAGLRNCIAECVVSVLRYSVSVSIEIACDVPVVVVERNINGAVNGEVEQSADAARAL